MRNWQSSLGLVKPCRSVFPSKKQDSGSGASSASASKESPAALALTWAEAEEQDEWPGLHGLVVEWSPVPLSGWTLSCWRVWQVEWAEPSYRLHHLFVAVTAGLPGALEPRGWGPYVIAGCTLYTTAGPLTSWGWTALCFQCTMSQVFVKKKNQHVRAGNGLFCSVSNSLPFV